MTTSDRSLPDATRLRPDLSLAARLTLAMALVVIGATIAACESETAAEIRPYTDSAGRSCNVDLHDISATATCDADPSTLVTCDTGQEAAFVLNDDYDFETEIWTLESCGGCIDRPAHRTFVIGDTCANVECDSDEDCVKDNYMCSSGLCRHM